MKSSPVQVLTVWPWFLTPVFLYASSAPSLGFPVHGPSWFQVGFFLGATITEVELAN